jgi:hypothetical protein
MNLAKNDWEQRGLEHNQLASKFVDHDAFQAESSLVLTLADERTYWQHRVWTLVLR